MSNGSDAGASAPHTPRLWGSELLLRKVPLYAQARQYAAVNADNPQSESNTLGYGVSSYPLLAAVRASHDAVNSDTPSLSSTESASGLINRSPFCNVHRAGYAHVPAQRKWMSTNALTAELASSTTTTPASAAAVRRAAAAVVLDDALGPPTLAEVLEPWFGVLEDHLTTDAQVQHEIAAESTEAKKNKQAADKTVDASTIEGEDDTSNERIIDPDLLRCQQRKRVYELEAETRGAVYTRLESAMMHYNAATSEEKKMLHSIRASSGSSDNDGVARAADSSSTAVSTTGTPPEAWGGRMLSLVTSAVASERVSVNDEQLEQQQKVLAYLKRVRWISTQWSSSARDASALKDAAASPSWGQLTEAARVRAEMAYTQEQRRRFRRTRRVPTSNATRADDGDAAN